MFPSGSRQGKKLGGIPLIPLPTGLGGSFVAI